MKSLKKMTSRYIQNYPSFFLNAVIKSVVSYVKSYGCVFGLKYFSKQNTFWKINSHVSLFSEVKIFSPNRSLCFELAYQYIFYQETSNPFLGSLIYRTEKLNSEVQVV